MKLVFVTGSLVHGGAERHSIALANRLAERGHECHAVYVKNDPSQLGRLRLRAPGTVRCLDAASYFDFRALAELRRFCRELNPSVVVAANPYALMYASLARRSSPLLVTLHSTYLRSVREQLQMLAYRPFFWSAECAVFVCERQRSHWRRRGVFARRNRVIYNGVDPEFWKTNDSERATLRRVLGFNETDLVVGMSAVLRPEKNHVQLVEALAMLRRRGVPARALMIGDGPTRPAVEALARRLGVAGEVAITGLQQDVRPLLSVCDAVALPSFTEAFSLAAIEAMALGKPVVHADVGGAAEMIEPGRNGFLFPVGDTRALAERLAALADPELRGRMGAQARASVETRFAERAMVERYESLLQELASARSKRENLRRPARAH